MKQDIEALLRIIELKLDWGVGATWQTGDFENLHQLIFEKTAVSLSSSTLRRIWGRVDYNHVPSTTTLNTLAKFAGYENWRAFLKQKPEDEATISKEPVFNSPSPTKSTIPWIKILSVAGVLVAITVVFLLAFKKAPPVVKSGDYRFSSRPLTREIPNSVIFTYDAGNSEADSIFIQQSWDSRTLTRVAKDQHQHTSIYYEPGFYQAKLIADNEVVKEHPLLIPTKGWLGIIDKKPVPVYLDSASFIYKDSASLAVAAIQKNNITMVPEPPVIRFYNVGNFDPVSVDDFSFSAEIKNGYKQGSAACQLTNIILVTDDGPIIIPLSVKGCVSELNLYCIDHAAPGKTTDLSAFGVDFSNWAQVLCKGAGNKIQININGKLAYESALPPKKVHILGMSYIFQGTGAVKNVNLQGKDGVVFHAF